MKVYNSYIYYGCIFFLMVLLLSECSSPQTDYRLSPDITKYARDSFDIKGALGGRYKILSCKIKNGKVLISTIDATHKSYFVIADIKNKKIEHIINNPIEDYYSTTWDATPTTVIWADVTKPYDLSFFNLNTETTHKEKASSGDWLSSTDIISCGNQLFYLGGPYGVAFVDIKGLSKYVYRTVGNTTNPMSSTISYPINNSLNLLSGHTIASNIIRLYAIDYRDSIKWTYVIHQNQGNGNVALLTFNNSFVIKYDSSLVCLNKTNGKILWKTVLKSSIYNILKWQDKILVYSLVNPKGIYPDTDSFEYMITMKLFDISKDVELWSNSFVSIDKPSFGIFGNDLLITDKKSLRIFEMDNGKETGMKKFAANNKNNYFFEMLTDLTSGDFYIKSFEGKIYW